MGCDFLTVGFNPIVDLMVVLDLVLVVVTTCGLPLELVTLSGIISRELSSSALSPASSSSSLIRIRRRCGIRETDLNSNGIKNYYTIFIQMVFEFWSLHIIPII